MSEQEATLDEFVESDESPSRERTGTPIGELPSDWAVEWLDDLCSINPDGFSEDDWPDETFEYISLSDVSEGTILQSETTPVDDAPSRAQRKVREGDILVGTVRPKQVSHGFVTEEHDGKICSSGFGVLRSPANLNPLYLLQEVLSHRFFRQMEAYVAGSGYPAVKIGDLRKHRIAVPPLQEQRKIASTLYTVDQIIQKTEKIVDQIQRVKSGLLQDLFDKSKFDNNNFVSVGELGDWGSGSTPSKDNSNYWGGRIPWLAPKDVFTQDRNRVKDTEERLTKLGAEETNLYPKGSIAVVVRSGVLDRMLPVAKIESEMAVNQDIKMLVPDSANPDYLLYAFEAYSSQIRQRSRKQGTTWVDSIQMLPFMRFELPIPSSVQQKEIVEHLRQYDDLLLTEKEYLSSLQRLKQGLMQDLLSGEVRTHDKDIELVDGVLQHG